MKYSFLLLTVTFFLTVVTINLSAQIEGKITLADDNQTYIVSVIPQESYAYPLSITNNAQISLRAPAGSYLPGEFTNVTGFWSSSSIITSPDENPDFEYFSFYLAAALEDAIYTAGEELILFSFINENPDCLGGIAIISNEDDPFLPQNSQSVNIGNYFSVLGAGIGNAYVGNVNEEGATCPEALSLSLADNTEITVACPGETTDITVNANGGAAPYTVTLQNMTTGTATDYEITEIGGQFTAESLPAGQFALSIIDGLGQTENASFSVLDPDPITVLLTAEATDCELSENGAAHVQTVNGGTVAEAYSYTWHTGDTTSVLENVRAGWYYLTVSDDNGCSTTDSILVTAEAGFTLTAESTDVLCFGENSGSVSVTVIDGSAPFTYTWEGQNQTFTGAAPENLPAGDYSVTVVDATGICAAVASVTVNQPAALTLTTETKITPCELIQTGEIKLIEPQNGTAPYLYAFDGADFTDQTEYSVSVGAEYSVTVEDALGCQAQTTVYLPQPEPLRVDLIAPETAELGDMITIEAVCAPRDGSFIFDWEIPEMPTCDTCSVARVQPTETSRYTLTVRDTFGCRASASVMVVIEKNEDIFIPTAFSPDSDGNNDFFTLYPGASVAAVNNFTVFNRWGSPVYSAAEITAAPQSGWDGTAQGQPADTGIYLYRASVTFIDGRTEEITGDVLLVR